MKAYAVLAKRKEGSSRKYSALDALIPELYAEVAKRINELAEGIESAMPYKAQYILEELIKELQEAV